MLKAEQEIDLLPEPHIVKAAETGEAIETTHTTDMKKVHGAFGYAKELFQRFGGDQCGAWAASLSFFSILSIAPVLLCALAVLGFLIHDPHQAAERMLSLIDQIVPDRASARAIIQELNVEKSAQTLMQNRGMAGVVGVLSLFWAALQIFVNAIAPMNAAFRATETRNWLRQRVVALGLLLTTGALFLLSMLPSVAVQFTSQISFLHVPTPTPVLISALLLIASIAINAMMFAAIYHYLPSPSARVTWRAATTSGIIIAVLWEAARFGFNLYLKHFANYNKLYGSLGGLIALIFWIYYSSMILLLGAEIAKLYQDSLDAKQRTVAG